MLKISRDFVDRIQAAGSREDLYEPIQNAITLELGTIPPYFCAYCTLKPGTNRPIARILKDIFIDEMLHMTLMCNLMIALDGKPSIVGAGAALVYPGKLPMNVGNSVTVPLRKCSIEQIRDVFMEIEKPENPIDFLASRAVDFATIGEFYRALVIKLEDLGDGAFNPDFSRQVLTNRFDVAVAPITSVQTAKDAILDVIVRQGEGTDVSPEDELGNLAHYYRFKQIVVGKELVADASSARRWSYTGRALSIDSANVVDMEDNPKASKYPAGSASRIAADAFNAEYSALLRGLDDAFNGNPASIGDQIGAMSSLTERARDTLAVPTEAGKPTGLPFEYVP